MILIPCWGCAQSPVSKKLAPDYNDFIPAEDEMDLGKIDKKIKGSRYSSGAELRADFHRIYLNAQYYNTPGRGRYGGPGEEVMTETSCTFEVRSARCCRLETSAFLVRLSVYG